MNMPSFKKSTACVVMLTHIAAFTLPSAQAAPGTLANAPLYLSTSVEPNIMFLLDDSGSMEWEFLAQGTTDGIPTIGGGPAPTDDRYYILPSANNSKDNSPGDFEFTVPSVTKVPDSWRARNASYNALYYNPAILYEPWDGVNGSGTALYTNASPTTARVDPNNASAGTFDLTAVKSFTTMVSGSTVVDSVFPAHHYLWTDTNSTPALNGNGIVDATDARFLVEIKPGFTYVKSSARSDCVGATCTYAEEIQNFANWYTYYRKRVYAAKKAIGGLIDKSSGTRMGLYTYNNDLIKAATSMSTAANKLALLQSTYGIAVGGGTPARTALKDLGALFEGTTNSPILSAALGGTCQQNFSMVVTDGYWNGSSPSVGNTDSDGAGTFDGAPYADTYSDTLADVAMHYYERDLKTGLANKVPTTAGVDNADHQHMVTYTVAFGVIGTLNPATTDPKTTGFVWPDPAAGDNQKIDDTWHAAYNGRGKFLSAQDPAKLAIAATSVISDIEERSSSAAAVAFNSTSLNQNSVIYQAQFNTVKWSGELLAFALDPNNGNILSTTPIWNAGTQLNAQSPASRVILTYNPTTNTGIPFTWDTSALSTTQQADLNMGVSVVDNLGLDRVAYLRGDRTKEGSLPLDFRKRSSNTVLGDIAHSNPVYVGEANLLYPDIAPFPTGTNAYSTFKATTTHTATNAGRPGVIYVGSNDGMLHGFDAATGNEVMAYIPHNLFSANAGDGLHYLTEKTYGHRYYVDLGTTISDAFIASVPSGAVGWKTVLIGSERGGGRGVFALDVTNPSSFSESGTAPNDVVMWEFTHADLGYTFSKPAVALMKNGRWATIFGNGYNDTGDGKAKLFIVYLDGGLDGAWTPGTDYLTITTGVGTTSARNGLAAPNMIDTNGDKVVDRIYAGDLEGNIWVFDVNDLSDTNWTVAYKAGSTPKPLFTAMSGESPSKPQPITSKPSVARHVSVTTATPNQPNLMVYFGTGQYIATGDTTSTATQTFYGVWDSGTSGLLRAKLTPQTITTTATRTLSNTAVAYTASGGSQRFGWYIDLHTSNATTGERVVVDSLVRGNEVYFNTLIPNNVPCSFGGSGWSMRVNRDNGGLPAAPVFDTGGGGTSGTIPDGVVDGKDNNSVVGELVGDAIMTESKILGNTAYISTSDGKIVQKKVPKIKSAEAGRQSWREIIQQ